MGAACRPEKSNLSGEAWTGGRWRDRIRLWDEKETFMDQNIGDKWSGQKLQDRFGGKNWSRIQGKIREDWEASMGGGRWYKDRLGMGQFMDGDDSGKGADIDEPAQPTDAGDEGTVDDDVMETLSEGDPNEEAQIAAQRARRRRALMNKFNKQDTIRTSGRGAKQYA